MKFTRRKFLKTTTASAIGLGIAPVGFLKKYTVKELPSASLFSKYLGFLSYEELGAEAAKIGFEKIDLAIRKGGHVLPENVKSDFKLAFKSLKREGINIPMVVTDIVDANDKYTENILNAAAEEGIKYYRMGYYLYDLGSSVIENLDNAKSKLEKLEKLNRKYNMKACYQNHSGAQGFVGGPLWDLHYMLKDFSPEHIGVQFDIMHASVEGGYGWPISLQLLAPWINSLALMDFSWVGQGNQQSQPVALGTGTVDFKKCISEIQKINFSCPITIKCEHLTKLVQQSPMTVVTQKTIFSKLKNDLGYYKDHISRF